MGYKAIVAVGKIFIPGMEFSASTSADHDSAEFYYARKVIYRLNLHQPAGQKAPRHLAPKGPVMTKIRIAQAQINPTVGDFKKNLELIEACLDKARARGAHLVALPELCVCGYPPEDLLLKPQFVKDSAAALSQVACMTKGINAVVGFPLCEKGKIYNAAAVLSEGKHLCTYRKLELPNYGVFDEKRYFEPGRGSVVLKLGGARIMITICEDLWVDNNILFDFARQNKLQAALNISCSPFYAGKLDVRRGILAKFAAVLDAPVFYTNLVGGQDELVFDGGSLVMAEDGSIIDLAKRFEEDLLITELEFEPAQEELQTGPEDIVVSLPAPPSDRPAPRPREVVELDRLEEIHKALVLGLKDYMSKNGFKKAVLGLSGGIDSALVAALAVEALGAQNVTGVTMPSQFTSSETKGDAELLAEKLGMELLTAPIAGILKSYLDEISPLFGDGPLGVEAENLQARIRGNILMALSNRFGWLVLTTGNKSEVAVGYCTLYGDTAGGFALIKDLPKTLVYELSERINQVNQKEMIPRTIITRPPTAELKPDQKDEDSLPPYNLLDPVITAYVEEDKVPAEICAEGHSAQVVEEVARLVDLNEYKRRQAPPGIKITPKAFGKDRRLPITNHYHPGLKKRV
jgi:NAD+ synthase (glutamine-hydrolysing)